MTTEDRIKLALELTKKYCTIDEGFITISYPREWGGPMFAAIMDDLWRTERANDLIELMRMRGPN